MDTEDYISRQDAARLSYLESVQQGSLSLNTLQVCKKRSTRVQLTQCKRHKRHYASTCRLAANHQCNAGKPVAASKESLCMFAVTQYIAGTYSVIRTVPNWFRHIVQKIFFICF